MEPVRIRTFVARMERHQIGLYLAAIMAGGGAGFLAPGSASALELAINPVLGLLLYATFLGIPFASLGRAARDLRFMSTVLVLNFAVVPVVVFGLSRFVAGDQALLVGVLLVLLTPCIDYVIVFTGLAGGASDRLLAAAPAAYARPDARPAGVSADLCGPRPGVGDRPRTVRAGFGVAHRRPAGPGCADAGMGPTVLSWRAGYGRHAGPDGPALMMATLAVVVASQIVGVRQELGSLLAVVPLDAAFLLVMVPAWAARRQVCPPGRPCTPCSGVQRRHPKFFGGAAAGPGTSRAAGTRALVVVTQTLVELVGMVAYVRFLPLLAPADSRLRH